MIVFQSDLKCIPDRYRDERKDQRILGSRLSFHKQGNFSAVNITKRDPELERDVILACGQTKRRPDDDQDRSRAFNIALTRAYRQL